MLRRPRTPGCSRIAADNAAGGDGTGANSVLRAAAAFPTAKAERREAQRREAEAAAAAVSFLERVERECGGYDSMVCQVVARPSRDWPRTTTPSRRVGIGLEIMDDAGFQDLPRPVLCLFPRPRVRLPREGARLGAGSRTEGQGSALAYLDAREGGADPRAAEAAAQAVAEELPQSNRQKARNSRVDDRQGESPLAQARARQGPATDRSRRPMGPPRHKNGGLTCHSPSDAISS